jgi:hypothetical protein
MMEYNGLTAQESFANLIADLEEVEPATRDDKRGFCGGIRINAVALLREIEANESKVAAAESERDEAIKAKEKAERLVNQIKAFWDDDDCGPYEYIAEDIRSLLFDGKEA